MDLSAIYPIKNALNDRSKWLSHANRESNRIRTIWICKRIVFCASLWLSPASGTKWQTGHTRTYTISVSKDSIGKYKKRKTLRIEACFPLASFDVKYIQFVDMAMCYIHWIRTETIHTAPFHTVHSNKFVYYVRTSNLYNVQYWMFTYIVGRSAHTPRTHSATINIFPYRNEKIVTFHSAQIKLFMDRRVCMATVTATTKMMKRPTKKMKKLI